MVKLAYRLYRDGMATVHESNCLQELIKIGKERTTMFGMRYGLRYQVKNLFGGVVWDGKEDGDA